jgi:regulator of protease activity HflC (stomatin/prohibitin superfamily)
MSQTTPPTGAASAPAPAAQTRSPIDRLVRLAVIIIGAFILFLVLFSISRSMVYKIRPYERGLHLRGGRFVAIDEPGWHFKFPFVDTVIGLNITERPGKIEQLAAMTSDDVTMDVSLFYTYKVTDPRRYALEVEKPDEIVYQFVQGMLRDVVNTKPMDQVMHSRAEINQELMQILREKEDQYGVEFVIVQIQSASPPSEVIEAIKDRMVAAQREQQAKAEAAQRRIQADGEFYAAQKEADSQAYQMTTLAAAEAEKINLTAEAQQNAVSAMMEALAGKGELAAQYIQLLIAQELRANSKWIITGGNGGLPQIDLGQLSAETPAATPAPTPTVTP